MSKSRLRRTAGMLKYKVLDCWPYKLKELYAAKLREQLRPRAFELPQLAAPDSLDVEIHMLCGKKQLDMGIWASWSILRFLDNAVLYVHSDGTLEQEEDIAPWRKILPGMVLISKADADSRVRDKVAATCPLLYVWRCHNWCSAQVVDMHLFGASNKLVVMDSDVLCFRDPIELRSALCGKQPGYRWNKDERTCYLANIELLNQITGLRLPEAYNAGFQLTPRFGSKEFGHLERMIGLLKSDGRIDTNHFWSTQTYCAMCAARSRHAQALPDSYAVTLGRTSDDVVVRHYTGVPRRRPRYFTEGVPSLLADLAKHRENDKA